MTKNENGFLGSCKSCHYYVPNTQLVGELGECRRYPMQTTLFVVPSGAVGQLSGFPRPKPELWCGEYDPRLASVNTDKPPKTRDA